jgi:hypothetical protein
MTVLHPRKIGSVRVLEQLGEGGMAVVHRAEDLFRPDLELAVKFLKGNVTSDADVVKRFLQEGEVLKGLRHSHLVEVYDFGRIGLTPYLLMELLPGGSVKACYGESPATFIRRIVPVADALAFVHGFGVIHRDLKPSNLLFSRDGRLKVTDFGVCLWEGGEGTRSTRSQMVVGTLGYMAPEQHGDPRNVDGRCDVYAMGAILYEFTAGYSFSQVQLPPASVRPGFPPRLARILVQSLAADPARRLPDMETLREELRTWLDSAEAAGWGEEPMPGFSRQAQEESTLVKDRSDPAKGQDPFTRLGPYLDAIRSGGVGVRRTAAEGLVREARISDESFLLESLETMPDEGKFAVVNALGTIGGEASLAPLLSLNGNPYAQREAVEAVSRIASRCGREQAVLSLLTEVGLGASWRWTARARLGDVLWMAALANEWTRLSTPLRIHALEAARELSSELRAQIKAQTREDVMRAGGNLKQVWDAL